MILTEIENLQEKLNVANVSRTSISIHAHIQIFLFGVHFEIKPSVDCCKDEYDSHTYLTIYSIKNALDF